MNDLFLEVIEKLSPLLTLKRVEKGTLLHKSNTICYDLFLVKVGVVRSFYFVDGKDVTAHFAMEYGIVGAADSIIRGKKSRYTIETLEESEVYVLDYREMESFLNQHPNLERPARRLTQLIYIDLVERLEGMTFLSAKDRYQHLMDRYPDITQRVSLGHIASYLGITQETLSRVRSHY